MIQYYYPKNNNKKKMKQKQYHLSSQNFHNSQRKRRDFRTKVNETDDSSQCEQRNRFSMQYNSLTKKLKIKKNNNITSNKMINTISSYNDNSQIYLKTESYFKSNNYNNLNNICFLPIAHHCHNSFDQSFSHRSNPKFKNHFSKSNNYYYLANKKYYKVQKPSVYCQFQQQAKNKSSFTSLNTIKNQQKLKNSKSSKNQVKNININTNTNNQKQKILQNCILLWKIRKQLTHNSNTIKPKDVIKAIKSYIMRKDEHDETHSGLQKLMSSAEDQCDFKQLLVYQKLIVIGIVELIRLQRLHFLCIQYVSILNTLMGLYKYILKLLFKIDQPQPNFLQQYVSHPEYNNLIEQMERQKIQQKISLSSILLFMCNKLNTIYRLSPQLLKKIKIVVNNAKKVSVNRSFYDLLTIFAVYLNNKEIQILANNKVNKYLLNFMTCPSPYIVQPRCGRNYSLVLDLDETLLNTKFDSLAGKSQYYIAYRPYCFQFIQNLSKFYEIIIFTSSVSTYAQQVITKFQAYVSHILCRQHTIKLRGQTIKDLSKIGRSIQSIIIVDNLSHNFRLQTQNGIQILSWYGDKKDRELQKLEKILIKLIENNPKDVRESLRQIID